MFWCWWHTVQLASLNLHLTTSLSGSCASKWMFWKQFWGILSIIKKTMQQDALCIYRSGCVCWWKYKCKIYVLIHFHDVILKSTHLMFGIAAETGDLFVDWVSDRRLVSTWVRSVHPPTPWTLSSQQQPDELIEIFNKMHLHFTYYVIYCYVFKYERIYNSLYALTTELNMTVL